MPVWTYTMLIFLSLLFCSSFFFVFTIWCWYSKTPLTNTGRAWIQISSPACTVSSLFGGRGNYWQNWTGLTTPFPPLSLPLNFAPKKGNRQEGRREIYVLVKDKQINENCFCFCFLTNTFKIKWTLPKLFKRGSYSISTSLAGFVKLKGLSSTLAEARKQNTSVDQ